MSNPALLNVTELMVLDALRSHVKRFGSQQEFASSHGVSPSYVCDVLAGRRSVPEAWVSVLGYRKIGWVLDSATAICCEHGAPWQGRDCWKCNDLAAECKKASVDLSLDGECFMREGKRIDPADVPTSADGL